MTNALVGDVYQKIIEDVVNASATDFEESGVSTATLQELQEEWQAKLSQRGVAQMPWDPKPQPPQQAPSASLPSANGLPQASYTTYDGSLANGNGSARIKTEAGAEQFHGLPNGGYQQNGTTQGGIARAQQLVQEQYGTAASASLNAMQQRGGLALPGQQTKPQGLQLPASNPQSTTQQFQQQQQAAMARQQQQLAQQQAQPRIKVESDGPQPNSNPQYSQTDGADEGLEQWRVMLAERRAVGAEQRREADRMMHDQVMRMSERLQSGLMVPLDEHPSRKNKTRRTAMPSRIAAPSSSTLSPVPQVDGELDDEDEKPEIKDEDDENAINSDLDDTDDEAGGAMGDDDDDMGDSILCTYDKVQRVKNKWKCTLKDGVMSVNGKEWVFHKGMGEFEW